MTLYRLNRVLHRDLGYFFIGMTLIYAISGIAINHRRDWNPNYSINNRDFTISRTLDKNNITQKDIDKILISAGESGNYKNYYFPNDSTLRVFVNGGNITVDLKTGESSLETIKQRPILKEVNFLHYNPGELWTWFSDIFCVAIAFLAISGLFIIKGRTGLKWRVTIIMIIGIVIPIILLILYL